jgi:hypothetical protein
LTNRTPYEPGHDGKGAANRRPDAYRAVFDRRLGCYDFLKYTVQIIAYEPDISFLLSGWRKVHSHPVEDLARHAAEN